VRRNFDRQWKSLGEEVLFGIKEWRMQHPHATLKEIEVAIDERLAVLRARMVADAALASAAAEWEQEEAAEQPTCPQCGAKLKQRGVRAERHLQTHGGQEVKLVREYGVCPVCGAEFFPPG
jgi:hypothetical protein